MVVIFHFVQRCRIKGQGRQFQVEAFGAECPFLIQTFERANGRAERFNGECLLPHFLLQFATGILERFDLGRQACIGLFRRVQLRLQIGKGHGGRCQGCHGCVSGFVVVVVRVKNEKDATGTAKL